MKKIFSIALIISVALVSCKKSSTPGIGNSGVQATIANTTTIFNSLASASFYALPQGDNTDTTYSFDITAYSQGNTPFFIDLAIVSNQPITAGTVFSDTATAVPYEDSYSSGNFYNTNQNYYYYEDNPQYATHWLSINYSQPSTFGPYTLSYGTAGTILSPTTLTITAISATSISGTFQGTIYSQNDSTGIKQVITNGKFIAPVVNDTQLTR